MQRSRSLLLVGVLAAGVAAVFVGRSFLDGGSERGALEAEASARGVAGPAPDFARAPQEDASPSPIADRSHELDANESRALVAAPTEPAAPPPADSQSLRGRVLVPDGTPADETLEVVVYERLGAGPWNRPTWLAEPRSGRDADPVPPVEFHRAAVDTDGHFTIAAPRSGRAWIDVDGRYLRLDGPLAVPLDPLPEGVELRPALGGWIVGHVETVVGRPPATAELEGAPVELRPAPDTIALEQMMGGGLASLSATLDEDGRFELRAVPKGDHHAVVVRPESYAHLAITNVASTPGERTELALHLEAGATLRGTAVDETGRPAAGATVRAIATPDQPDRLDRWFGVMGTITKEVTAAEDGTFLMRGAPTGRVSLRASVEGWKEHGAAERELVDGQEVEGIRLELVRGNVITGFVHDGDGQPIAGAEVTVAYDQESSSESDDERRRELGWAARGKDTTSGDDGGFVIEGLDEGPYLVRATTDPDGDGPGVGSLANVRPSGEAVVVVVGPATVLRGTVRDTSGAPVDDFHVLVDAMDEPARRAARSLGGLGRGFEDAGGAFELVGVPDGAWKLRATTGGVRISEPVEVVLPDHDGPVQLVLSRPLVVVGSVRDEAGRPIGGASVRPNEDDEGYMASRHGTPDTKTDATGRFRFEAGRPGPVELVARAPGFANSDPLALELTEGTYPEEVVLTLRRGGSILGTIYGADGRPAPNRMVNCMLSSFEASGIQIARSDADGRFRFENLRPGSWNLIAVPEDLGEDRAESISGFEATRADVVEGEVTEVVLGELPADPVLLSGRVRAAGEPLAEAQVRFMTDGENPLGSLVMSQTDDEGTFEVELKRPGTYLMSVEIRSRDGRGQFTFTEDVPETPRHHVTLDLPVGSVAGHAYGPDGQPLEHVRVGLVPEGPVSALGLLDREGRSARTDDRGAFRIAFVEAGTHSLVVEPPGREDPLGATRLRGIVVEEGETTDGIELRLAAAGTVVGTVVDESGDPVEGALVFARDASGLVLHATTEVETDAKGAFRYENLAPGTYTVSCRTRERASGESRTVRVVSDDAAQVELRLELGGFLVVESLDGEREPVAARISVRDADGREMNGLGNEELFAESLFAGFSLAEQRIGPLPPGRYTVLGVAPSGAEKSRTVDVDAGAERKLKLRFRD